MDCCGNCAYYTFGEAYCSLMDELVECTDNCGLFKRGETE